MPAVDAALPDAGANEVQPRLDVASPPLALDSSPDVAAPAVDVARADDVSIASPDVVLDSAGVDSGSGFRGEVSIDRRVDVTFEATVGDAGIDGGAGGAVDGRFADAWGSCSSDDDCEAPTPACSSVNRCVACTRHDHCPLPNEPICDGATNRCVGCTTDKQCADQVAQSPGVCMSHLDKRCATDAETVYVGASGTITCSDDVDQSAGSARSPYCSLQNGVLAARSKGKVLVVVSGAVAGGFSGISLSTPLTVVGRDAVITPSEDSDGISLSSGDLYLRDVKVMGNQDGRIGIRAQAASGATLVLRMEGCTIAGNPGGGILLADAAFDIRNTVVTDNGAGQTGTGVVFGGIRVDRLAASGPADLTQVSIIGNRATGLSCAAGIQGAGVLATGNTSLDVADSCGVESCVTASTTCGAQP